MKESPKEICRICNTRSRTDIADYKDGKITWTALPIDEKKVPKTIYVTPTLADDIEQYATGKNFSEKCIDLISSRIERRKRGQDKTVRFIDLFAGWAKFVFDEVQSKQKS